MTASKFQTGGLFPADIETHPHIPGLKILGRYFDEQSAHELLVRIRTVVSAAPLYRPCMPGSGKSLSVRQSNCGNVGWYSDQEHGYRYIPKHPETNRHWPSIPTALQRLWKNVAQYPSPPEACLINFYDENARMGLHVDRDETATDAPVVMVSLGDDATFRIGGRKRSDSTTSFRVTNGDVVVLSGDARMAYHGIDRIWKNSHPLIADGGRVSLTLRRVSAPNSKMH